jgi:hypothetical protein
MAPASPAHPRASLPHEPSRFPRFDHSFVILGPVGLLGAEARRLHDYGHKFFLVRTEVKY